MNTLRLAALAALCGAACSSAEAPADWIRRHAHALATSEPRAEHGDLAPLGELVGLARIVGLGEATHGTHECFTLRRRLSEYLVRERGFDVIAIEASMADARAVDAFVQTGEGDPRTLLAGLGSWIWYTQEMLDMVGWMREYRAAGGELHFAGLDMQQPRTSLIVVRDYIAAHAPQDVPALERDYNAAYTAIALASQRSVARALATLAGELPIGRRVRLSGHIRTAAVTGGFAGLWLRAEGAHPAIDTMQDRAPRGTTDWGEAAVEIEVPAGTERVVFGAQLTGDGSAWFDDLRLDGRPVRLAGLALFEADAGSGAEGSSLRLVYDAAARAAAARQMLDPALVRSRQVVEWLQARPAEPEAEWALQNARLVVQLLEMLAPGGAAELAELPVVAPHPIKAARDRSLAANVGWVREHLSRSGRIVLWAHNLHVGKRGDWMGRHLGERYGADYVALGFAFGDGRYRATGRHGVSDYAAAPVPADSLEALLGAAGLPCFLLELRDVPAWLAAARPFRAVGPESPGQEFFPAAVAADYDVIAYLARTSPSQLPR
ncbi:MAG TPA: erythromycin esterase family protein [Candidatus Polarisedimenticolaceae bacterium]|nr:erythromycin esterase family protein [Candidatus Polarisedimenticolaceae bacterium]